MKLLEPFARARIMLIDDTPANLDLLRALLRRAGLQNIHAFIDPREAVAQLETVQPDLVLVDLHMPHLDGYAVLDQLVSAHGFPQVEGFRAHVIPQGSAHVIPHRDDERVASRVWS